eukprot:759570-Hanusia_phi.AAC.8
MDSLIHNLFIPGQLIGNVPKLHQMSGDSAPASSLGKFLYVRHLLRRQTANDLTILEHFKRASKHVGRRRPLISVQSSENNQAV